jgi:hypothetical protein
MAIRYAVANGNWSNTATWDGGTLPAVDDDVFANNFTVTIDGTFTVLSIRNSSNASPAISVGGFFTFANGGILTCTSDQGIYVGLANVPTLQMTLSSGNVGTFYGTVLTMVNITNYTAIRLSNTGTLNLVGNYSVDGSVTNSNGNKALIISINGGTLNITGELNNTANIGGSQSSRTLDITGGVVNITGDVNNSVTGTSTTICPTVIVNSGIINVTGNVTTTGRYAITSSGNVNIIGNVTTNGLIQSINMLTASTIDITGSVTSGNSTPAIVGTVATFAIVRGNIINVSPYVGIYSGRIVIDDNTSSWTFRDSVNSTDRTLYAAGVALGNPNEDDVREGVDYGPSLELTGTLAVPTPDNVRKGVPTDDTVGTADLTAEDFFDAIAISTNDIAIRLRNVATVETTGDQIANL